MRPIPAVPAFGVNDTAIGKMHKILSGLVFEGNQLVDQTLDGVVYLLSARLLLLGGYGQRGRHNRCVVKNEGYLMLQQIWLSLILV